MTSDRDRIEHMIQGIARIEDAMKDVSKEEFFQSRLLLDAMSFNFAILGEAARFPMRFRQNTRKFPGATLSG